MTDFVISVRIDAETGDLKTEFKGSKKEVKDFKEEIERASGSTDNLTQSQKKSSDQTKKQGRDFDDTAKSTKNFTESLKSSISILGGVSAGVATLAGATLAAIKPAVDLADQYQKTSLRLGVSTEELSKYAIVAKLSGIETNELTNSWQRQTRRISEAVQGTGEAVKALDELHLSADRLNTLSPEDQFDEIANALQGVESQQDKVRLAMKFWDTEGVKMLQIVNQGADGLERMKDQAGATGNIISGEFADASAEFNDKLTLLDANFSGISNTIATSLLPIVEEGIDLLITFAERLNNFTGDALRFAEQLGIITREFDLLGSDEQVLKINNTAQALLEVGEQISVIEEKLSSGNISGRNKNALESTLSTLVEKRDDLISQSILFQDSIKKSNDSLIETSSASGVARNSLTFLQQKQLESIRLAELEKQKKRELLELAVKEREEQAEVDRILRDDEEERTKLLQTKIQLTSDYEDSLVGITKKERDYLNAFEETTELFEDGVISAEVYQFQIDRLGTSLEETIPKTKALTQEVGFIEEAFIDAGENLQRSFTDTIRDALDNGVSSFKDFKDVVLDILKDLAANILSSGLTNALGGIFGGQSSGGGLLSSLFGGGSSGGGIVSDLVGGVGSLLLSNGSNFGSNASSIGDTIAAAFSSSAPSITATVAEGGQAAITQSKQLEALKDIGSGLELANGYLSDSFIFGRDGAAIVPDSFASQYGISATNLLSSVTGLAAGYGISTGLDSALSLTKLPEGAGNTFTTTAGVVGGAAVAGGVTAALGGGAGGVLAGAGAGIAAIPVAGWVALAALAAYNIYQAGGPGGVGEQFKQLDKGDQFVGDLLSAGLGSKFSTLGSSDSDFFKGLFADFLTGGFGSTLSDILISGTKTKFRLATSAGDSLDLPGTTIGANNQLEYIRESDKRTAGVTTPFGTTGIQLQDVKDFGKDKFDSQIIPILETIKFIEDQLSSVLDPDKIEEVAGALDGFYDQQKNFDGKDIARSLRNRTDIIFESVGGRFLELFDLRLGGDASTFPSSKGADVLNTGASLSVSAVGIEALSDDAFGVLKDNIIDLKDNAILPFIGTLSFIDDQFKASDGLFKETTLTVSDLTNELISQARENETLTETYQRITPNLLALNDLFLALGGTASEAAGAGIFDFSREFFAAAGGDELGKSLIQSFVTNFGDAEAILLRQTESLQKNLELKLSEIGRDDIDFSNFAEQISEALPTLEGDQLATWLEAGDLLAKINENQEKLNITQSNSINILEDLTDQQINQINSLSGNYENLFGVIDDGEETVDLQTRVWEALRSVVGDAIQPLDDLSARGFPELRDKLLTIAENSGLTTSQLDEFDTLVKALGTTLSLTSPLLIELEQITNRFGGAVDAYAQSFVASQQEVFDSNDVLISVYDTLSKTVGDLLPELDSLSADQIPGLRSSLLDFAKDSDFTAQEIDTLSVLMNALGGVLKETADIAQIAAEEAQAQLEAQIEQERQIQIEKNREISRLTVAFYEEEHQRRVQEAYDRRTDAQQAITDRENIAQQEIAIQEDLSAKLISFLEPFKEQSILNGLSEYKGELFLIDKQRDESIQTLKELGGTEEDLILIQSNFSVEREKIILNEQKRLLEIEAEKQAELAEIAEQAAQAEIDRVNQLALFIDDFVETNIRSTLSDFEVSQRDIDQRRESSLEIAKNLGAGEQQLSEIRQFYANQRIDIEQQENQRRVDIINAEVSAVREQISAHDQLITSYDQIAASIGATTESSIDNIRLSILDDEGKYNFYKQQAEDLSDSIQTLTDPALIGDYFARLNTATTNAFNLLDDVGKNTNAPEFIDFLEGVSNEAQQRVEEARQAEQIAREEDQKAAQKLQEAADKLSGQVPEKILSAVQALIEAAQSIEQGGDRLQEPAQVNVTVEASETG